MGTTYKVILVDYDQDEIEKSIFRNLDSINQEMSTYIDSSSISKLNKSKIGEWIEVSENFIKVATYAQQLCVETEGAFNISSNLDINVSKKVEKLDQNAASFILQGAIDYIKR